MKKTITPDELVKRYYACKSLTDSEKVAALHEIIRLELTHWQGMYLHGCNDPQLVVEGEEISLF